MFLDNPWISVVFFLVAIGFCMLFIFVEQVRFTTCINWFVALVTVSIHTKENITLIVEANPLHNTQL